MRVGVLTFFDVPNPGAFMQCYGTVQTLRALGHEPVVIDYAHPRHRPMRWWHLFTPKRLWHARRLMMRVKQNAIYASVERRTKPFSRPFRDHRDLETEHFDAVVVGADIVWNYQMPSLGRDPVYFGHHLNTDRLIAFAPSCGSVDMAEPLPEFVTSGLPRFSSISVRDESTARLVERVTGARPPILCDPALLLEHETMPVVDPPAKDYLLVYGLPHSITPEAAENIRRFARSRNLKVQAIGYLHEWADANHPYVDPFEWLGWLRRAKYVVTTAFHGTVFSLILGSRFAIVYHDAIRSKTETMVANLGLTDRVWDGRSDLAGILDTPWDVPGVQDRISAMAGDAKAFLKDALSQEPRS